MNQVTQIPILPFGMMNCFLIKGDSKYILVDAGTPGSESKILKNLSKLNIKLNDISLMILSHAHIDHFGGAAQLKNILNVPVLAHKLDSVAYESGQPDVSTMKPKSFIGSILKKALKNDKAEPIKPDIYLEGEEEYDLSKWGVNGKVIHTPGHTSSALSIILENGEAIIMDLASSGILLGGIAFNSRMKHPPFHDNMQQVKNSLDTVLSTDSETFYLGHGNPVSRNSLQKYRDLFF